MPISMGQLGRAVTICATISLAISVSDQTNPMQIRQSMKPGIERNAPVDNIPSPESTSETTLDQQDADKVDDADEDADDVDDEDLEDADSVVLNAEKALADDKEVLGADIKDSDSDKDATFEEYTMDDDITPPPAGCSDMGCLSGNSFDGPNCGGNSQSCEALGMIASGYYKTCGWSTCKTGWKVRCAQCGAGASAASVAFPTPAPAIAAWVAPAAAAPAPPPPAAAPINMVMPTNAPVFAPAQFDSQAVNKSRVALAAAQALFAQAKANLTAAQLSESATKMNITLFTREASTEHSSFLSDRGAAVSFAKKRQIANISIFKATKEMNDAFFAEKGATQGAQTKLAEATNHGKQRLYYQTLLVDAMTATRKCLADLHVGQAAVKQAYSGLSSAKSAAYRYNMAAKSTNNANMMAAHSNTKQAERMAMKASMEKAYADASVGLTGASVPPYGGGSAFAALDSEGLMAE